MIHEVDRLELGFRVMLRLQTGQRDLRWFEGLDWRGHA